MLNIEDSCCFTGHRPDKFDFPFETDCPEYHRFNDRLCTAVADMIEKGCTKFYCGMAQGFDISAGEYIALIKQRNTALKLIGVVPFVGQEKGWSRDWQQRYHALLEKCDEVITLNDGYVKWAYDQRNRYMVDRCRYVLTYFDGSKGGTGNTVTYAVKNGREVLNINTTDPIEELASQIRCTAILLPPEDEN